MKKRHDRRAAIVAWEWCRAWGMHENEDCPSCPDLTKLIRAIRRECARVAGADPKMLVAGYSDDYCCARRHAADAIRALERKP